MSRRVLRGFTPARFTALRKSKMSMTDLARITGVAGSTIYAWESGKATPQVDKLAAAMKVLGSPIEDVVLVPRERRFPSDWRVLGGFTQPQLAAAAGIATSTLQTIERGEAILTDERAATLSQLVNTTQDEYRAAWRRARDRPPNTPA
ncbi:helix-turn-helix domain-containing protein [Mycobacteroides abscessus]|uniref:helix-turn-helix domain-containing protein n=1 Tax=Mycobacteroides abscessus TaxID=36809 RepID=UPI001F258D52|nr:helix-turn-helix transcriptional regulator [Mycobacteroides abscessus]